MQRKVFMNRVTGLMIYEVLRAAPNNSPDGNGPRLTPDDFLEVTSMSAFRKLRNILDDHNSEVFKELTKGMDPDRLHIFESRHRGYGDDPMESKRKAMDLFNKDPAAAFGRFWDARVKGIMALEENVQSVDDGTGTGGKKKVKGETGKNNRQAQTGPFSLSHGISVAPVVVLDHTITKYAPLRDELIEKRTGDIAPSALKYVAHAIVTHRFGLTPGISHRTYCVNEDIELLKKLLPLVWDFSTSLTRPAHSINMLHVWWGEHENSIGSFSSDKFYSDLMPVLKDPNKQPASREDYNIPDKPMANEDVEHTAGPGFPHYTTTNKSSMANIIDLVNHF